MEKTIKIYLMCSSYSDRCDSLLRDLGLSFERITTDLLPRHHPWAHYTDPTVLLVDNLGEEEVVWGGVLAENLFPTLELLEARLYTRSNDFRYLLSWLSNSATGVDGVVWLPTKFTDLQTPKIYVTDSVSDGLDQGTSIKISGTPRVNYSDPNQSSDKIAKAIQFAKINQQVLLDHWHYQICSAEAIIRIKAQKSE